MTEKLCKCGGRMTKDGTTISRSGSRQRYCCVLCGHVEISNEYVWKRGHAGLIEEE